MGQRAAWKAVLGGVDQLLLVDTGASSNVLSPTHLAKMRDVVVCESEWPELGGATGPRTVYGKVVVKLQLCGYEFFHTWLVADIDHELPLLGDDFMRPHQIRIDYEPDLRVQVMLPEGGCLDCLEGEDLLRGRDVVDGPAALRRLMQQSRPSVCAVSGSPCGMFQSEAEHALVAAGVIERTLREDAIAATAAVAQELGNAGEEACGESAAAGPEFDREDANVRQTLNIVLPAAAGALAVAESTCNAVSVPGTACIATSTPVAVTTADTTKAAGRTRRGPSPETARRTPAPPPRILTRPSSTASAVLEDRRTGVAAVPTAASSSVNAAVDAAAAVPKTVAAAPAAAAAAAAAAVQ
ncbi:MAG: Uncharacterized protein FD161_4929, partial [Limisphaerales bacterium]